MKAGALKAAMTAEFTDYRAEFEGNESGVLTLPQLLHRYGAHHAVDEEQMVRAILQAARPYMCEPTTGEL